MEKEIADLFYDIKKKSDVSLIDINNTLNAIEKGVFGSHGEELKEYLLFLYSDLLKL